MLPTLRFPRLWLAIGWILVAVALIVCLIPNGIPGTADVNDKFMHAVGYFGLTVWFAGIYPRSRYTVIALSLLAMGIAVEILQGGMDVGRKAELNDFIADAGGVGAGIASALAFLGGWIERVESWFTTK